MGKVKDNEGVAALGMICLLTWVVFMVLRCSNWVDWSWGWVFSPMFLMVGLAIADSNSSD